MSISIKKIVLVLLVAVALTATPALADGLVPCGGSGEDVCTWSDLFVLANGAINFLIFTLGIPLAVIIVVVSGIQLVLHPNDATAKSIWKDRLQKGLIGLLIMMCAYLLVKVVVYGLTEGRDDYELRTQVKQ